MIRTEVIEMEAQQSPEIITIKVNNVEIDGSDWPTPEEAVVHELLRQRAVELEYLHDDVKNEQTIQDAVEKLLQKDVEVPEPTDEECRHWYQTHLQQYRSGELVHARHILFQITPGVLVPEVRSMAEAMLLELRTHPDKFAERARTKSNCPSGAQGGQLGQIKRGDTVPEFEKAIFDDDRMGVIPELIHTRHGFHIVSVDERIPGEQLPFEAVHAQIVEELGQAVEKAAVNQYVQILIGRSEVEGVDLLGVGSPMVQ